MNSNHANAVTINRGRGEGGVAVSTDARATTLSLREHQPAGTRSDSVGLLLLSFYIEICHYVTAPLLTCKNEGVTGE